MSYPYVHWGDYGDEKHTCSSAENTFGVPVGTRMVLPDGRTFYLAQASTAAAIGAGQVVQEQSTPSASVDMDVPLATSASVGDTTIGVALTASTVAADAYASGYIYINDAEGEGHVYRVKENTAIAASGASASFTVTLEENDAVAESCKATTTLVGLYPSPYKNVIVRPTTLSGRAIGVTPTEVTAGYYFWCQTWGEAACLVAATVAVVYQEFISDTAGTAGAIAQADTIMADTGSLGDDILEQRLGYALCIAAVDTDYQLVFLTISH